MQPYFFPYLGYFQLIKAVDAFVIYDDVNYIKGGWINRNNILINGGRKLVTMPLLGGSPNKLINEIDVGDKIKILKNIKQNYSKAPYFNAVYPMIEDILTQAEKNLAVFLSYQLQRICCYLELRPKWYISSMLEKDNNLRGQEKVISICEKLGATHYINAPGGKGLYDNQEFKSRKLKISFVQPIPVAYQQFGSEFISNLSIIDVLMFNDRKECTRLLNMYDLV